jgi:glycosyl transferase family 29 (putative sialyltransferase)
MRDPAYTVFRKLYRNRTTRRFLPVPLRDRLHSERKLLKDSLRACRRYRLVPRSAWHRHIYGEIIYREDVWSGETSLQGLSSIPLFDAAAASGDEAGAKQIARSILDRLGDELHRHTWRTILAARALLVHDNLAIGDRLLLELGEDEDPARAQIDRVLLTLFHEEAAELNRQLVEKLVASDKAPLPLIEAWMRRRWLHEGPNHTVLQDMLSYGERLKDKQHQALLLREPLALAFLLDDVSVVKRLLLSYPQLEQSYPSVLPLARHLASRGFGSTLADKRAEILAFAKLHAELDEGTSSLTALLRDKTRSIAIVGNSACELGSGKGPLIDSYDVVARFNRFSVDERFTRDYGRKCTIHVRNPRDVDVNAASAASDWTLINRPDLIYRERQWKNVLGLSASGVKISALPTGFHQHLYRSLRGEPSAGIMFCSLVKTMHGCLSRDSCFGFSFIDQVGQSPASAHYFERARPSFKHRWTSEKAMFEELTRADAPSAQSFCQ